ncbi:phosphate ABC transporter permease PstA [Desulfofustis limnaeus]|jgi:phosphate transport system permease protein|uniref:Phosphate transport system permease protein PstA n=1 Tax=Desulfofustis limnaeus TaxID=2740163 RepID=A0ABM7W651_9BACT|nr:phosphate ABC transporter permease PstA [Desulfofustis limnaeus]MDX9894920.1 phosphate ABC transporter permease PstA [Desulfofustis sp.]BDD86400.1 phosphate transport system permease protein PstA [Desulfofustis limnaeus]
MNSSAHQTAVDKRLVKQPSAFSVAFNRRLKKRYRAEQRFKHLGILAIGIALAFLALLLTTVFVNGYSAFRQTFIKLDITFDKQAFSQEDLLRADYQSLVKKALQDRFPEVTGRQDRRLLNDLISPGAAFQLLDLVRENPKLIGTRQSIWLPANDDVDMLVKGKIDMEQEEINRRIKDKQSAWYSVLRDEGRVELRFNAAFFTKGDSREPELAGILGAVKGSFYTLLITLLLSFPMGVAAAIYLEEFAPDNRFTNFIEVNINNLAAVPSIIFGLLGLAIFINFWGVPRSTPLVGGLVLTLMTLPTIIIAARASLKSVPPSIREAALGIGASKIQTVFHHVLPLALPGMLTGTIIGMAQALGETAPLLMIGMVAFIVDVPTGITDPAAALPVQIFLWADSPERAFTEKTSAAIIVLLVFLVAMNAAAVYLRKKFEITW